MDKLDSIVSGVLRPKGSNRVLFDSIEMFPHGVWIEGTLGHEFYPWASIAKITQIEVPAVDKKEDPEAPGSGVISDLEDLASALDEESDEQLGERASSALEDLVESFILKGEFASEEAALDALTELLAEPEDLDGQEADETVKADPLAPEFLDSVDGEGVDDDDSELVDE